METSEIIILSLVLLAIVGFIIWKSKSAAKKNKLDQPQIDKTIHETPEISLPRAEKPATKKKELTWLERLGRGLEKSRTEVWGKIASLVKGNLTSEEIDKVEELLYTADISSKIIQELIGELNKMAGKNLPEDEFQKFIFGFLKDKMAPIQSKVHKD